MEEMEVISWTTMDALRNAATRVIETVGDLDTDEQMSVFFVIEDDYIELFYSELDANYIRHFEDEDELFKNINLRKQELGEEDLDTVDYFDDSDQYSDDSDGEDLDGYNIRDEDDQDDF